MHMLKQQFPRYVSWAERLPSNIHSPVALLSAFPLPKLMAGPRKLIFLLVSLVYDMYNYFQDPSTMQGLRGLVFSSFSFFSVYVFKVADLVLTHRCPGQAFTSREVLKYTWPICIQSQAIIFFAILHFKKYLNFF